GVELAEDHLDDRRHHQRQHGAHAHADRDGHAGHAEDLAERPTDHRFGDVAHEQAGDCDPQLGAREHEGGPPGHRERASGGGVAGLRVRLELVAVHGHVGELLGDEVAVGRDDHEDREDSQQEQQDRGEHDGHESTDGGAVLSPVRLRAVSTPAPSPRTWLMLFGAICAEVTGTMALRATVDSAAWLPLVPAAYLVCFLLLGLVLRTGMPIGVAYGIWGAAGVSLTAVLGAVLFDEF